ncbi:MAG: lactate racemase domain-containing protein [Planctomycetaceae bacterium]
MDLKLPSMYRLRQSFERPVIDDVAEATRRELEKLNLGDTVKPDQTVAVTAGSRGIRHIATITKTVVDHIKSLQAKPFIVPAMGSHGGASAEGQAELIARYGITAEEMGVEIRSSMDTVVVGQLAEGVPVHFDKHASEADHVMVVGRIKPHTMFVGDIESGLHKMMLIGLGKHNGAWTYHKAIKEYSFEQIIRAVAEVVLKKCRVVAGLAIVENAYDETARIEAVAPNEFYEREKELLQLARNWLPRLPFDECDLLIVDAIGKEISGTGMDTNVIGRKYNDHAATERDTARCKRIFVRGLTEATRGNACGIGIAEFTLRSAVEQMDAHYTGVNCITSGHPTAGMIPLTYENDFEAIAAALQTIGLTPPEEARVIHIRDTLHLETVDVSEAYSSEFASRPDLEVLQGPEPMQFDDAGHFCRGIR